MFCTPKKIKDFNSVVKEKFVFSPKEDTFLFLYYLRDNARRDCFLLMFDFLLDNSDKKIRYFRNAYLLGDILEEVVGEKFSWRSKIWRKTVFETFDMDAYQELDCCLRRVRTRDVILITKQVMSFFGAFLDYIKSKNKDK